MGKCETCENEYDKACEHGVTELKDHAQQAQPDYVEPTSGRSAICLLTPWAPVAYGDGCSLG